MSNMKVIANAKQIKSHCSNQQNKVEVEKGVESDALAKLGLKISLNDWKQLMVKSHYYEQIFNYLRGKLKDRLASVYRITECIVSPIFVSSAKYRMSCLSNIIHVLGRGKV